MGGVKREPRYKVVWKVEGKRQEKDGDRKGEGVEGGGEAWPITVITICKHRYINYVNKWTVANIDVWGLGFIWRTPSSIFQNVDASRTIQL